MNISFIVPAYNAQRYLGETLESILIQEGSSYEIIVIDDGSTDQTGEIADGYARKHPCIRVIRSVNRGVSHARNLGIEAARGRYLAFLDSDDVLCDGAYPRSLDEILEQESYDLISFGYLCGDDTLHRGRPVSESEGELTRKDPEFHYRATRKGFWSYLYRREMIGKLRFFLGIRYSEDTIFNYLAARRSNTLLCVDRYWLAYRNHLSSAVHNTKGWRYLLTDCVPAWYMAAHAMDDPKVRWDCLGMVYSQMGEYLRLGAMSGIPLRQLQQDMRECVMYQELLDCPDTYWRKERTVELVNAFQTKPRRIWLKCRMAGIVVETIRRVSRTRSVRRVYFQMKYRTDISRWLPASR